MKELYEPYAYLIEDKLDEARIQVPEVDLKAMMSLLDELYPRMAGDQRREYKRLFEKYWQALE